MRLTPAERALVGEIATHCADRGVSLRLFAAPFIVVDGENLTGWFLEKDPPSITCTTGRADWVKTLVHEYCHCLQFLRGDFVDQEFCRAQALVSSVTEGKRRPGPAARRAVSQVQACELDAERNTVSMLLSYGVFFDVEDYIRAANAYIFSYVPMVKHGSWTNLERPHRLPEILEMMPTEFLTDYTDPPEGFNAIVLEKCIGANRS